MSNYGYFNTWGYVDGAGDFIPMQSFDETQIQEIMDKSFKSTELKQEGQDLHLSINGENVSTVTIEDKYLKDVSFDNTAKEFVFKIDDDSVEKRIGISELLNNYSTKEELTKIENKINSLMKNFKLKDGDEMIDVMKTGGDVLLMSNIKPTKAIQLSKNSVIDLNDYTINNVGGLNGDNIILNAGTITFKNGTINPSEKATNNGTSATILVKTITPVHLTLENMTIIGKPYALYMNNTSGEATLTINSGRYYTISDTGNTPIVYVQQPCKVTINGGTFGKSGEKNNYVLNMYDALRHENNNASKPLIANFDCRQYIEVKGGSFYNFNPSNNGAEGANTNFVADGYRVTSEIVGEDTIYTVVPN